MAQPHNEKNRTMSNSPSLYVYAVRGRGKDKKDIWTRIGAAFAHDKGGGLTLELEALPRHPDAKIVLMPPKAAQAGEGV